MTREEARSTFALNRGSVVEEMDKSTYVKNMKYESDKPKK